MDISYTPEEIYQIGIEIEQNGMNFYQAAADVEQNKSMKKLFTDLAAWEKGHVSLFKNLKKSLSGQPETPVAQNAEHLELIKNIADSHIFVMEDDVVKLITNCNSPQDVLRMALQFEKDSIVLYVAMKEMVPGLEEKSNIDRIIQEELMHTTLISAKLKKS